MTIEPVPSKWLTTPEPTGHVYVKFPYSRLRQQITATMLTALTAAGNGEPTPTNLTTAKSLHRYGLAIRHGLTTETNSRGAPFRLIIITDRGRRLLNGETDLT